MWACVGMDVCMCAHACKCVCVIGWASVCLSEVAGPPFSDPWHTKRKRGL